MHSSVIRRVASHGHALRPRLLDISKWVIAGTNGIIATHLVLLRGLAR